MQNAHWKITQPCHEPIEKMDITERGHYCHSCQKEVLDPDKLRPEEIDRPTGDSICGRITVSSPSVVPVSRWSAFALHWLGAIALFFIPLKKGKSKTVANKDVLESPADAKKTVKPKRIIGTVRDGSGKPVQTKVVMRDEKGNLLAESQSIANGRYMMMVDTPLIDTQQLHIAAPGVKNYEVRLDTPMVFSYPKDSLWISSEVLTMVGVMPYEPHLVKPLTFTIPDGTFVFEYTALGMLKNAAEGAIKGADAGRQA